MSRRSIMHTKTKIMYQLLVNTVCYQRYWDSAFVVNDEQNFQKSATINQNI
uniref:Uncharacterized protein n=1 Tax=Rhizophora mucronata TaxID=61149 RepID=A0A2P2N0U8_RHIMU